MDVQRLAPAASPLPSKRRRTRSEPSGKGVRPTDRLVRIVDALYRKGSLPAPLLYEIWRDGQEGGLRYFKERLTAYFHETSGGGPFLTRPTELNPPGLNSEPAWYDLAPGGIALARAHRDYAFPRKQDPFRHRAMSGAIAASFELLAPGHGIEYVDKEEIARQATFPRAMLDRGGNPLRLRLGNGRDLIPDDLFGLRYRLPDGRTGVRYFVREDDRGSERFEGAARDQTLLRDKLERYLELFSSTPRAYTSQLGVTNLRCMFITTRPARIERCRRFLEGRQHADRFLFKALPEFGPSWRTPRALIKELFQPWTCAISPFHITGQDDRLPCHTNRPGNRFATR